MGDRHGVGPLVKLPSYEWRFLWEKLMEISQSLFEPIGLFAISQCKDTNKGIIHIVSGNNICGDGESNYFEFWQMENGCLTEAISAATCSTSYIGIGRGMARLSVQSGGELSLSIPFIHGNLPFGVPRIERMESELRSGPVAILGGTISSLIHDARR